MFYYGNQNWKLLRLSTFQYLWIYSFRLICMRPVFDFIKLFYIIDCSFDNTLCRIKINSIEYLQLKLAIFALSNPLCWHLTFCCFYFNFVCICCTALTIFCLLCIATCYAFCSLWTFDSTLVVLLTMVSTCNTKYVEHTYISW